MNLLLWLAVPMVGISSVACASDSFYECTSPDGRVAFSVIKCDKGEKQKLIVLDQKQERNGHVTVGVPQKRGDNAASSSDSQPARYSWDRGPGVDGPKAFGNAVKALGEMRALREDRSQNNLLRNQCMSSGKDFDTCLKMFPGN